MGLYQILRVEVCLPHNSLSLFTVKLIFITVWQTLNSAESVGEDAFEGFLEGSYLFRRHSVHQAVISYTIALHLPLRPPWRLERLFYRHRGAMESSDSSPELGCARLELEPRSVNILSSPVILIHGLVELASGSSVMSSEKD